MIIQKVQGSLQVKQTWYLSVLIASGNYTQARLVNKTEMLQSNPRLASDEQKKGFTRKVQG